LGDQATARELVTTWLRETRGDTVASIEQLIGRIAQSYEKVRRPHKRRRGSKGSGSAELQPDDLSVMRCLVPLCTSEVRSRGMCHQHHREWSAAVPADQRGDNFPRTVPSAKPAPGDPKPMAVALAEDDVPHHRRLDCPAYDRCLNWCALRGWPGFSCKGCKGPSEGPGPA
jgi:hypothetical protein